MPRLDAAQPYPVSGSCPICLRHFAIYRTWPLRVRIELKATGSHFLAVYKKCEINEYFVFAYCRHYTLKIRQLED